MTSHSSVELDDKLRPKYLAEHSVRFQLTVTYYSAKLWQCSRFGGI